jgi:hypothetical protein
MKQLVQGGYERIPASSSMIEAQAIAFERQPDIHNDQHLRKYYNTNVKL